MSESNGLLRTFMNIRGRIRRVVLGIVPPEEVEDIVQETYVRVCQFERKGTIRKPRSILFRTAQNLALDHMKRAETRLTSNTDAIEDLPNLADATAQDATYVQASSDEEFAQFCEAVRQLPQQIRRAFVLKKVYGHSQREIANKMNISENVVEKYIARGMRRCEETLDEMQQFNKVDQRPLRDKGRSR